MSVTHLVLGFAALNSLHQVLLQQNCVNHILRGIVNWHVKGKTLCERSEEKGQESSLSCEEELEGKG